MGRVLTLVAGLAFLGAVPRVAEGETLAFQRVRVFDGSKAFGPATVVVRDGVIHAVGRGVSTPAGATVVDGTGLTLLPGLIDSHTHTFGADMLRQALVFGVTTELDMFTAVEFAAAMRSEQKKGEGMDRADLFSAGTLVTSPGGHGTEYGMKIPTLSSAAEAQAFVDARIAEGSDYIKIVYDDARAYGLSMPTISKEALGAVIEAAHRRGKMAVVHIGDLESARAAVAAGADGLVHVFADAPIDAAFVKLVVARKTFVIPTLTVIEGTGGTASGRALIEDQSLAAFLTPADLQNLGRSFPKRQQSKIDFAHAKQAAVTLDAAGVALLVGTDAPNPGTAHGASIHRELELLVASGVPPARALAGATSVPARKFGLRDRGRIAPELRADLLLVRGDPTTDIRATRNIVGVWKRGVRAGRDAYRDSVAAQRERSARLAEAPPPAGSESGLVSDFEGPGTSANFGAGWMASTDAFVGGKSKAEFKQVEGGANRSQHAMIITGDVEDRPQPRWAGVTFYPGPAPMAPANLSAKKALSFWTQGDGKTYSVMLFTVSRGFQPSLKPFVAGPQWKQVRFELSAFDGAKGSDITGVFFGGGAEVGKFELKLDDVRFE